MKKILFICALLGAVVFTSCRPLARAAIKSAVAALDSDCPKDMGNGGRCMQVFVEDNSVIFEFEINEQKAGRTIWHFNRQEAYDLFSGDPETAKIRKLLQSAKYNLVCRLTGKHLGDQRDIIIFDWRQ